MAEKPLDAASMLDLVLELMEIAGEHDERLDLWTTERVHCGTCGRGVQLVLTVYHWETQTGEWFEDPRCSSCRILDEMSKN